MQSRSKFGLKVSNRIFAMIDRVEKWHFKFKRKLRLPKFKFIQGIEKIFGGCLIKRFVYFNQHTLDSRRIVVIHNFKALS